MKMIRQYGSYDTAMIDKGYLESNGINCVVTANAISSIFPAPGAGTGDIELYVPEDKYKEAENLLNHKNA